MKPPKLSKKTPKSQRRKVNHMRTKLLQGLEAGMNVSEAGRHAGYGRAQSAHKALHLMAETNRELLAKLGMPTEKILKNFIDKTEAEEIIYFHNQGVVMDHRKVKALGIQIAANRELARIADLYPRPESFEAPAVQHKHQEITINLGDLDDRRAEILVGLLAKLAPDRGQPVLDAKVNADEGRSGPEKPV